MLRLATDEDFNNRIVRGLLRRQPDLDILRVQDAGLAGRDDEEVLAWAAREGRILITHDVTTMKQTAYDRIAAGLPMPGVFELSQDVSIGRALDEILLLVLCSDQVEWAEQVRFLPLK
ncbi:MAG TPA: DUF5615 family PIN-like protein [Pyrinomonadaceae bacterium]|nr:DUF5615 family PIN-like protein [Pyrinomonadaceae bacterium]